MSEVINTSSSYRLPNRFSDQYHFEDILDYKGSIIENTESLDFSDISFIEPYSMLSLILLGKYYLRERGEKLKIVNLPLNINQYLTRMDFFKTGIFDINDSLDERLLLKRSSSSRRIIEITEIPNKEIESVNVISNIIELFRIRASHIMKFWLSDYIVDFFITVISELCQNIFEHSLDSGYLTIQTYSMGKNNIVRLVISDSGIGMKKSFDNKTEIKSESDANLIEMALTTPISSKRKFGYGLCQVNTIVEKLKGAVFIRSGNASVSALYHRKSHGSTYMFLKNGLTYFDGTQISISLSSS